MRFADPEALAAAADALSGSIFDDEALALHVPGDGDVASLHALLDRLDAASIHAEHLTVHTPDLDDVFLALTGHAEVGGGSAL
jgi:ABC-2 type transport system ATP-binding protein